MASEKVTAMIEEIKAMSVLELSELVHEIEDVFGVSAAAAVAAAPVAGAAAAAEEKTEFDVVLTGFGDQKIKVIKAVREITNLGLAEAKAKVEGVPLRHQGAGLQGRGRGAQEEARGSRRFCRTQVIDPYTVKNLRAARHGGFCMAENHKGFPPKVCSLLRTDFVRRWRTKSTLAA